MQNIGAEVAAHGARCLLCISSPLRTGVLKFHIQQLLFVLVEPGLLDPLIPLLVPALQHTTAHVGQCAFIDSLIQR